MFKDYCKRFKMTVTQSECIRCEDACPYLRECKHLTNIEDVV